MDPKAPKRPLPGFPKLLWAKSPHTTRPFSPQGCQAPPKGLISQPKTICSPHWWMMWWVTWGDKTHQLIASLLSTWRRHQHSREGDIRLSLHSVAVNHYDSLDKMLVCITLLHDDDTHSLGAVVHKSLKNLFSRPSLRGWRPCLLLLPLKISLKDDNC